jgi:ParB family chromosome partitioning protein
MRIENAKVRHPSTTEVKSEEKSRPSIFTDKYRGEYYNLDVTKLVPFHRQARKYFDEDELKQMAETIKAHGIRQPLTVISKNDDTGLYEVVSGERRLRAAIIAGLKTVPCIIIQDLKAAVEIALIENVQRKDLHPLELARAYQQLLEAGICLSKVEIATKLGLPKSSVTEVMQLLTLPPDVQDKILKDNIASRILFRDVLETQDESAMMNLISNYQKIDQKQSKTNSKVKRKILLKVVLCNNQISIDTNTLSKITQDEKNQLKKQLLEVLE